MIAVLIARRRPQPMIGQDPQALARHPPRHGKQQPLFHQATPEIAAETSPALKGRRTPFSTFMMLKGRFVLVNKIGYMVNERPAYHRASANLRRRYGIGGVAVAAMASRS